MYRCNKIQQRLGLLYKKPVIKMLLTVTFYLGIFLLAWQYRDSKLIDSKQAPIHNLISTQQSLVTIPDGEKTTLVYFFAPWCKVCHLSMTNFNDIAMDEDYSDIRFIAIAQDWASTADVNNFIQDKSITTQVVYGTEDSKNSYKINGYPTYYLIDKNGQVLAGSYGYSSLLGMKAFLALHTSN
jgi:thiol-disulfide isomerase/thioredoxin